MSYVLALPEALASAAAEVERVGCSLAAAHAVAAAPTIGPLAAAGDEVSLAVAALFSGHAASFQAASARAAAFHARVVQTLSQAEISYSLAEAVAVSELQTLGQDALGVVNARTESALGRPLIGDGANGYTDAQGVGTPGGSGGILYGAGGRGGTSTATGVTGGSGGRA
uniref:PE family protein n=1 Tax=Mycobacterium sp. Marseille-P9652 TaxID=2654950 RepID=UPI0018D04BDC